MAATKPSRRRSRVSTARRRPSHRHAADHRAPPVEWLRVCAHDAGVFSRRHVRRVLDIQQPSSHRRIRLHLQSAHRLAESDAFWHTWSDFPFDGTTPEAESLQGAIGLAHLVVRGHITDVYIGEGWLLAPELGGVQVAYAKVALSEVLQGTPVARNP